MNPNPEDKTPDIPAAKSTLDKPLVSKPVRKNSALPLVAAALGIALTAFAFGRNTTSPTNTTATHKEDGHGHAGEEHVEGEKHTEDEGHKEEAGHGEEGHKEGEEEGGHAEEIKFDTEAAKLAGIKVAPVAFAVQTSGIPFNGQIAPNPNNVVRVASIVPGRVTRLFVSIGDNVRRGQTVAIVESRAIGEAQSAYQQAAARLQNARANFDVVQRQARAGVFARAPLEAARRAQVDAQADVRAQEVALRQARVALDNVQRLARSGSFASPALEAARAQSARAVEAYRTAQAALSNAQASIRSAQSELNRRRQVAASGGYASRLVEESRRVLVAAQSARAAATSEVATTRANLNRARTLAAEGLVSQRDLETAQQAYQTATARIEAAQADERAASRELERQQRLASSNVAGNAEIGAAQSQLANGQADVRTRRAEVARAREEVRLANVALSRERANFRGNIANRREISVVETAVLSTRNALLKAQQTLGVANSAYERERRIFRQNLNNTSQVQAAHSTLVQAESDLTAARTALRLFKSAPGQQASVPIVAPISGVVQDREVAQGEVLDADAHLMTIADMKRVHVDIALPEGDISRVRIGAPVRVQIAAVPNGIYTGRIELIHSTLDPKTRTVEAHADLVNDGRLRFGMSARGQIVTSSGAAAVTVPSEAIQDLEGKKVVFVQGDEANAYLAREVEIGATEGGRTLIKNGLKPGEKVVVKGAFMVKAQAMKAELGHHH